MENNRQEGTMRLRVEGVRALLRLVTSAACAVALGLCVISTAARPEIGIAGASDADWTVLTIAPDGAWGTATEASVRQAIATAVERCRATSRSALGCGAYQVSIQRGWALGLRCGRENILRTGTTLAEVTESGRQRELELRRSYQPEMESCRQVVVVAPDGSIKVPQPQAIVSDSDGNR
jgi:hypothetical protein